MTGTTGIVSRPADYNADATEAFAEFKVNTYDVLPSDVQKNPSIAMASDGRFVIAWEGDGSGWCSWHLFSAALMPTVRTGMPSTNLANKFDFGMETTPAVAINDTGDFAIIWEVGFNIYVRSFDDDGGPVRDDVQVNSITGSSVPDVAIDATGRVTVVWRS